MIALPLCHKDFLRGIIDVKKKKYREHGTRNCTFMITFLFKGLGQ